MVRQISMHVKSLNRDLWDNEGDKGYGYIRIFDQSYRVASLGPDLAPQWHKGLSMIAGNLAGP